MLRRDRHWALSDQVLDHAGKLKFTSDLHLPSIDNIENFFVPFCSDLSIHKHNFQILSCLDNSVKFI